MTIDIPAPTIVLEERPARLTTSVMVLYGVGQIGAQVFRDTPAVLLPVFMTTLLGTPAWLAGLAILAPKLWIVFADPLMGSWSDRRKATWGRLPFLAAGAVATSLGFLILFKAVEFSSPFLTAAYVSLVYLLASTGFSAYSVPYLALASELGGTTNERTKLMAYRVVCSIAGVVIAVGLAQPAVVWLGGGAAGWSAMAAIVAVVCAATMLTPVIGLRGRPLAPATAQPGSLFRQLRLSFSNRPFTILIMSYLLQAVGQAVSYSVVGLLFIFVFAKVSLLVPFVLIMGLGTVSSQPLWIWLARRFGKLQTYLLSALAWMAVTLTWFVVRRGGPPIVVLPLLGPLTLEHVLALARALAIGVFNSGFIVMGLSMLTDTITYDRARFGRSSEGVFSGVFSAVEKFSFALGPALGGVVLSLAGFASSKGGPAAQTPAAIHGILLNFSLIPVAFFIVSLFVLRLYKLNPAELTEQKG